MPRNSSGAAMAATAISTILTSDGKLPASASKAEASNGLAARGMSQ
jgi:hypothetical protein